MKVLMIDFALPGNMYADGLCKKLSELVDLRVMHSNSEKGKKFRSSYKTMPVLYSGGKGKLGAILSYGITLWRIAVQIIFGRYDVVHVQTFKKQDTEVKLYKILKPFVNKFVMTVHNVYPHEREETNVPMLKECYKLCDVIFVHNEYSKLLLVKDFEVKEDIIKVIAHGVYENKNKEYHTFNENRTKTVYLQFGQIRRYKGLDILLNAISIIPKETRKKMCFIIRGKQNIRTDSTDYNAMIHDLNITDCIVFDNSHVTEDEKKELFLQADACICPYKEIFGSGVLLEAYTYHVPVIVSDIPVFVEEVDKVNTGLLFESENPEDLAAKIIEFSKLKKTEYIKFQSNIKGLIETKLAWDNTAKNIYESYIIN